MTITSKELREAVSRMVNIWQKHVSNWTVQENMHVINTEYALINFEIKE